MFTSGSTGTPKAVGVSHRALLRLANRSWLPASEDSVLAQTSHVCFDACAFETWFALTNGIRLVIVDRETLLAPEVFEALIRREQVSMVFLTTALFHEIAAARPATFEGVQTIIVGGDVLGPGCVRRVQRASAPERLIHAYGPTENGVFSTSYDCRQLTPAATTVPIGLPVPGSTVYVLGPSGDQVETGVAGDLHVGGDGVSDGYLRQPQLTAERFRPDLFATGEGALLYDTGDRARVLPDGNLDYLGRRDNQVKVSGFRVEPGEVEAALLRHPGIRQAAVVAVPRGVDRALVAYLTGADDLDNDRVRRYLRAELPAHSVPGSIIVTDRLPLTPSGKIDRQAIARRSTARREYSQEGW
ncbi:AMP-binding protein [Amycolatopsis rubida]|nr:AMP-binding protein [Amycolatopsis rubida]MYW93808.1 AMP-binding protein [Amycolatopsis rubida]